MKRLYNFKHQRKVVFLVGNIGSGKTTYAQTLKDEYVTTSRDRIRYMLGGGEYVFLKEFESAVWNAEFSLFSELLATGVNILIDEVNTNHFMRSRYLYEIDDYIGNFDVPHIERIAVVFPIIPKKEAVDRRMCDPHGKFSRKEWEEVWERFNTQYKEPTLKEGFNKIIQLKSEVKNGKVIFTGDKP